MVFKQPSVRCFHMSAALDDVEQIDCCKLLGVMFQSNFKMDSHVNYPRESEGLCFYRRWFVCLSVCLSVCLFVTTITK